MPKLKTHQGTAKRVKLTARKKILRDQTNNNHFQEKQRGGRQRANAIKVPIIGKIRKNIKRALGV